MLQRHIFPRGELVLTPRLRDFLGNGTDAEALSCGLSRDGTSREWIFAGQGEKNGRASMGCSHVGTHARPRRKNACFPRRGRGDAAPRNGSRSDSRIVRARYDWYREREAAARPGNLLLYASRDGGGRSPRPADAAAFDRWLQSLAARLGLGFRKITMASKPEAIRSSFERARIVVGPHGGALTNVAFAHESTLVVELGSAAPGHARFCFGCMVSRPRGNQETAASRRRMHRQGAVASPRRCRDRAHTGLRHAL